MSKEKALCHICKARPVSSRKSHFTPASATEQIFGERNKEEVHSISAKEGEIDTYFGRGNLKNTNPEIKKDPLTEADVFCKECEENLGRIEAKVTAAMNKMLEDIMEGKVTVKKTAKFNSYVELPINPILFSFYLYSVIWRQAFQQKNAGQDLVLKGDVYEEIRVVLSQLINLTEEEICNSELLSKLPPIICLTRKPEGDFNDSVNPSVTDTNPGLFLIGTYDCLIFQEERVSPNFRRLTGLQFKPDDVQLFANQVNVSRVGILPVSQWNAKNKLQYEIQARIYVDKLASDVEKGKSVSLLAARVMLHKKAQEIESETGNKYSDCLSEAFKILMAKE